MTLTSLILPGNVELLLRTPTQAPTTARASTSPMPVETPCVRSSVEPGGGE